MVTFSVFLNNKFVGEFGAEGKEEIKILREKANCFLPPEIGFCNGIFSKKEKTFNFKMPIELITIGKLLAKEQNE